MSSVGNDVKPTGRGGGGGRGGGRGGGGSSSKKESILELAKLVDSNVRVKCLGGRELRGTLRGYDELVNLVLDDCEEFLRGPCNLYFFLSFSVCNKMLHISKPRKFASFVTALFEIIIKNRLRLISTRQINDPSCDRCNNIFQIQRTQNASQTKLEDWDWS
mmetsp:Transcript_26088/g.53373  ORF Transcript_26088/g.53373 Transcript_26088/m.53373 type:complete len:161 (-) Transcript_26088:336-818(-)